MSEYKLSASLEGHEDDVRGVTFPSPKTIITCSRDATVRTWNLLSSLPITYDGYVASSGNTFVNAVAYVPYTSDFKDGLIVAGGKDTIIEVREPAKPPDAHAERLLIGHTHAVCALDVYAGEKEGFGRGEMWIVSGSWDGTARIWSVGQWECKAVLEGHGGSVWGVLAYDQDTVVTACADKLIRVFDIRGKLKRTIKGHTDVVRALCRLPIGHSSGAEFASASNDATIRLWRLDGSQVGTLYGHESFIYSLVALPSGELASTGEDRTLRIWKGMECMQTITHPAISVWAVAACKETGDIVTGASDKKARVFTRATERQADAATIAAFDEAVKGSAIPQQQIGDINKEKLPGPEFLTQKSGKKDGQVVMVRENDGTIGAYSWSSSSHEWVQVGTVVDAAGSSGRKQTFDGKDYDFVFDVDIEDGKPPLKLPYNLSQNPYEAATRFIQDNELSMNYLDEVANFITKNSQGATLGQNPPASMPSGVDPWGQESRYRPGDTTSQASQAGILQSRPKVLPQTTYLSIRTANLKTIQKKLEELNSTLDNPSLALDPKQLHTLRSLTTELELNATSTLPSSSRMVVTPALDILFSLLTTWPPANRLPVLDLLRVLAAASPLVAEYQSLSDGGSVIHILDASGVFADPDRPNNAMLAVRALANLFETETGRHLAATQSQKVQALVKECMTVASGNRNLAIAVTTLYINYGVLCTKRRAMDGRADVFDCACGGLEVLIGVLKREKDSEAIYRALVGVGTFLILGEEVKRAARDVYGIKLALSGAEKQAKEPRIMGVIGEIWELFK